MAEKKKLTVAEMLAAARKADSKNDAGEAEAAESAPAPEAPAPKAAAKPPAKPAAKPAGGALNPKPGTPGRMSVADMLAAARAEKTGEAKPAPKAAPVAKESPKPAPKPAAAKAPAAAASAPSGPKDTGSILSAARKDAKPGPITKAEAALKPSPPKAPAKPARPVPPMPVKPEYAKPKTKPVDEDRRTMLWTMLFGSFLGIGFTTMATTFGLWSLGVARFMFPNILTEPPSKFKVGFPANFAPGQVETKFIAQYGVWVVNWEYNGAAEIYALKSVCTHLGCTPNWLEGEQKFKCPCHGSGFYKDGINFEGPAPRPLERYAIRVADDGQLEIDKSKTFQEELGQWSDPTSFVTV